MIPSQMPELIQEIDLKYMQKQLHLQDISNDKVYNHILKILKESLKNKKRILDNTFHAIKHS